MRKNLYLFLALACFLALVGIFIVDGYMGVYDTVFITTGEFEQRVEDDYWQQAGRGFAPVPVPVGGSTNAYFVYANRGDRIAFRYEVDNRLFSNYAADIDISAWRSQEKLRDLASQSMQLGSFEKGEVRWELNTDEFRPEGIPAEQAYNLSVVINAGKVERRIVISVNPLITPGRPF
ncbi:MAG: hypothetical protein Q8Q07_04050 [Dehalococcoidales bacterium]|nr:hypothetical protein [Dehalococcoidales bacterium]